MNYVEFGPTTSATQLALLIQTCPEKIAQTCSVALPPLLLPSADSDDRKQ
jgi:hypothetical protein